MVLVENTYYRTVGTCQLLETSQTDQNEPDLQHISSMKTILDQLWPFETCLLLEISQIIEIALLCTCLQHISSKKNRSRPIKVCFF